MESGPGAEEEEAAEAEAWVESGVRAAEVAEAEAEVGGSDHAKEQLQSHSPVLTPL